MAVVADTCCNTPAEVVGPEEEVQKQRVAIGEEGGGSQERQAVEADDDSRGKGSLLPAVVPTMEEGSDEHSPDDDDRGMPDGTDTARPRLDDAGADAVVVGTDTYHPRCWHDASEADGGGGNYPSAAAVVPPPEMTS